MERKNIILAKVITEKANLLNDTTIETLNDLWNEVETFIDDILPMSNLVECVGFVPRKVWSSTNFVYLVDGNNFCIKIKDGYPL